MAISIAITEALVSRFGARFSGPAEDDAAPLEAIGIEGFSTDNLGYAFDAAWNLTNRVYDATGPKSYLYLYDDENQLAEMRTDEHYTPSGSRFKTVWKYAGLGRAREQSGYAWSGSAWVGFLNVMSGTRGSGSLPRQVERAARVLGEQ